VLFLAAPIAFKGRLVQYVGRVLCAAPGKHVVEVHEFFDVGWSRLGTLVGHLCPRGTRTRFCGNFGPLLVFMR
jgi:hypothetical protein